MKHPCCDDRWNPSGEVLGDVGHPQHVRAVTVEVAIHQISRRLPVDHVPATLATLREPADALLAHDCADQLLVRHMVVGVGELCLHATPPVGAS
jgi:hypothetical protein